MATRGKKILFGCAVGCGAALVLAMGGCFGFAFWVTRPGESIEPRRLVTQDATGYAEWILNVDDAGTRAFVETLFEVSQQQSGQTGLPGWLDSALTRRQNRQNEENLKQLLPLTAAWSIEPGDAPDTDSQVINLGLARLGNRVVLADWVLGLMISRKYGGTSATYRGEKIYEVNGNGDDGVTFFIAGSDLFFASDATAARRAIDRLREPPTRDRPPSKLERRLAELPEAATLRGVLRNDRGELQRVLALFPGTESEAAPDWSAVRMVTLSGGFAEGSSFEGALVFFTDDAEWRDVHRDRLPRALRRALALDHLPIEFEATSDTDGIRVNFRVEDIAAFLRQL